MDVWSTYSTFVCSCWLLTGDASTTFSFYIMFWPASWVLALLSSIFWFCVILCIPGASWFGLCVGRAVYCTGCSWGLKGAWAGSWDCCSTLTIAAGLFICAAAALCILFCMAKYSYFSFSIISFSIFSRIMSRTLELESDWVCGIDEPWKLGGCRASILSPIKLPGWLVDPASAVDSPGLAEAGWNCYLTFRLYWLTFWTSASSGCAGSEASLAASYRMSSNSSGCAGQGFLYSWGSDPYPISHLRLHVLTCSFICVVANSRPHM